MSAIPKGWNISRGDGQTRPDDVIIIQSPTGGVAVVSDPTAPRVIPEAILHELASALLAAAPAAPTPPPITNSNWRELLRQSEENFNRQFGISVSAAWVYRDLEDLFSAEHDKRCPAALNLSDRCNCGAAS